mmetsp:Transcript_25925/g.43213  ORF Transcript_25925/g.43213 Transcript_25925/m.43213 type:complete len:540 (-) Transcript_25925:49-1668(-)
MDFEFAAQRLQRDQSKLKSRASGGGKQPISAKAKREADYRKRQQQVAKEKRDRDVAQRRHVEKVYTQCERSLGVRDLGKRGESLRLMATSIYGDGDKIALPPSVLERLTSQMMDNGSSATVSSPWTFRVGILNPEYTFPASAAMMNLKAPSTADDDDYYDDDDDDDAMENDDDTKEQSEYLEELSYKYIAYSHATVVEFTQDEGHVGLPAPIAAALLNPKRRRGSGVVETMRTRDPASSKKSDSCTDTTDDDMVDNDTADDRHEEKEESDKTPGHLAWGAFDVPSAALEISLVTLPKGSACTLVPTISAIRSGFHNLKNVKFVLEQSLIRTRATLSIGDAIATWHRGVKYNLTVASVTPADWRAVSCINTDIEVDIGLNEEAERLAEAEASHVSAAATVSSGGQTLGGTGRTLSKSPVRNAEQQGSSAASSESVRTTTTAITKTAIIADLIPEPPTDQSDGICTVQIRADKGTGRRRFDVSMATVEDLFAFASSLTTLSSFQLVTRFPRRVVTLHDGCQPVLSAAGIQPGQELFMVEQI